MMVKMILQAIQHGNGLHSSMIMEHGMQILSHHSKHTMIFVLMVLKPVMHIQWSIPMMALIIQQKESELMKMKTEIAG